MLRKYRKFKRKYKAAHIFLVALSVVMFWWGVWGMLDAYFFPGSHVLAYLAAVAFAFSILYFDDFHLKELE